MIGPREEEYIGLGYAAFCALRPYLFTITWRGCSKDVEQCRDTRERARELTLLQQIRAPCGHWRAESLL